MNIRSLTSFVTLPDPIPESTARSLNQLVIAARDAFTRAGMALQTTRLAAQAFPAIAPRDLWRFARDLADLCKNNGIDYASLGALRVDDSDAAREWLQQIPAAIAATDNIFASVHITWREQSIELPAITAAARIIRTLAEATPDGFGNLRFAALANVPAYSPFFPAAYHDGGTPAFAIATEAAPLAVQAFATAQDLDEARANLVGAIERASETIVRVANDLAARHGFRFAGIDFSLAPYPHESHSIGAAMEALIGAQFGEHGTLFATAFLTDCINRARFPRVGFCGVMLPVLEDSVLGARSQNYSLDSLLLYSTVCGTGLDTIPLPGNTTVDALAAILLDVATLAVKLNKPLTARLLPIPGLAAGDMTRFNFEYFANARVLDARASALQIFETNRQVKFFRKT